MLASGVRIRSDVLIAADGLHSAVRRLVVTHEDSVVRPLGPWIATLPYPAAGIDPLTVRVYNEPGRLAAVHPAGGHPGAALMLRAPAPEGRDLRDLDDQKAFLAGEFAGSGCQVPDILAHVARADDQYFDAVSRVRFGAGGAAGSCCSAMRHHRSQSSATAQAWRSRARGSWRRPSSVMPRSGPHSWRTSAPSGDTSRRASAGSSWPHASSSRLPRQA